MDAARQVISILIVFVVLALTLRKLSRSGILSARRMWPVPALRRSTPAVSRPLVSVDRLVLTPHDILHLMRVRGRDMIVVTHSAGCTLIDSPPEVSTAPAVESAKGASV